MRRVASLLVFALFLAGLLTALLGASHPDDARISVSIFDPSPSHLWNRLYADLWVREDHDGNHYGEDSLDPPLWMTTQHLLEAKSHAHAIRVLDEFLQKHAETQINDPLKRAILQRDLWSIFDWSVAALPDRPDGPTYDREKLELQVRLAEVLRRLALTPDEIKTLPDNYRQAVTAGAFATEYNLSDHHQPFLPPDLFDPHGPWVGITPSPESNDGVAKMHIFNFSGRSSFLVFVRLPGGHKVTLDYFQTLWNFPQPWVQEQNPGANQATVNPDLPNFPAGTEVALVRKMNLFDNQGNLVTSNITESVQIRVYREITPTPERFFSPTIEETIQRSGQEVFEIKLSRPLLLSGKTGGLRAVGRDEREFSTFQTKGNDPIEGRGGKHQSADDPPRELDTCVWCHSGGGVHSLNSREALLRPNRMQMEPQNSDYGSIYWGDSSALEWKQNRYDWGLLNGYWKTSSIQ